MKNITRWVSTLVARFTLLAQLGVFLAERASGAEYWPLGYVTALVTGETNRALYLRPKRVSAIWTKIPGAQQQQYIRISIATGGQMRLNVIYGKVNVRRCVSAVLPDERGTRML